MSIQLSSYTNGQPGYNSIGLPMDKPKKPATKYEFSSMESARVMIDALEHADAKFIVLGTAIITDHLFSAFDSCAVLPFVGRARPEEDFTWSDLQKWGEA